MKRLMPLALLAALLASPVGISNVVGGHLTEIGTLTALAPLSKCTGTTAVLTCEPVNGALCNDVGNTYESAPVGSRTVRASSNNVWCSEENAGANGPNNNCSGTAKQVRNHVACKVD